MKKAYTTPKIYYESFALSTSISAGCEAIAHLGENTCAVNPKDLLAVGETINIFNIDLVCEDTDPDHRNSYCYHAPYEWNNVYSS